MPKQDTLTGGRMLSGPITVAPISPIMARPEWVRLPRTGEKEIYTGLGRSKLWEILQSGRVRSICLRKPGALRGARLISLESLLAYLDSMASEAPPSAHEETDSDDVNSPAIANSTRTALQ